MDRPPRDRPDNFDLIGAAFDSPDGPAAQHSLIICSAPRTASYELCRLLTAVGLGTPHEYFHPRYAAQVASRWGLVGDPLSVQNLPSYSDLLRRRRAPNGIFAAKLQYWQFKRFLQNEPGAALLQEAKFVHLYQPNVTKQFTSLRAALVSGRWDFTDRVTSEPQVDGVATASGSLEMLLAEDAGFRRLFVMLDKVPLFLTTDDVVQRPHKAIERIASLFNVHVDPSLIDGVLIKSAPYRRDEQIRREVAETIALLRERDSIAKKQG